MVTHRTIRSYLHRSIALSKKLEGVANFNAGQQESTIVGFAFLVRNRRLAQAISQLSKSYSYEKQILMRSMIEIHINYAWIRLKNTEVRAKKFINFEPLELLKILEDIDNSGLMSQNEYNTKLDEYKNKRSNLKSLFWNQIKRGPNKEKYKWDSNWASGTSLESRLKEVRNSETGKYDSFLYGLYRWFSSAVHGGPISINSVLEPDRPLRAKPLPESNPILHLVGAFVVLMATIFALAETCNKIKDLEPELSKLQSALNRLI